MSAHIKSFTDLTTWKVGHMFVLMIYEHTKNLPLEEKFGLTSQMRRAAVSVTSNIAEGFRRITPKDKIQFYTFALSSLTELQNQILICKDLQFINQNKFIDLAKQSVTVAKMIQGLIRRIKPK